MAVPFAGIVAARLGDEPVRSSGAGPPANGIAEVLAAARAPEA
jgi:hypothetical protein